MNEWKNNTINFPQKRNESSLKRFENSGPKNNTPRVVTEVKPNEIKKDTVAENTHVEKKDLIDSVRPHISEVTQKSYAKAPVSPQFDNKPAMSLKEALAKALSENSKISNSQTGINGIDIKVETQNNTTQNAVPTSHAKSEEQKRKEIAEEVLRKLIEE